MVRVCGRSSRKRKNPAIVGVTTLPQAITFAGQLFHEALWQVPASGVALCRDLRSPSDEGAVQASSRQALEPTDPATI